MRKGWCLCSILFMIMLRQWRKAVFIIHATYVAWQCAADVWFVQNTQHHSHTHGSVEKWRWHPVSAFQPSFLALECCTVASLFYRRKHAEWWLLTPNDEFYLPFFSRRVYCIIYWMRPNCSFMAAQLILVSSRSSENGVVNVMWFLLDKTLGYYLWNKDWFVWLDRYEGGFA